MNEHLLMITFLLYQLLQVHTIRKGVLLLSFAPAYNYNLALTLADSDPISNNIHNQYILNYYSNYIYQ